VVPVKDQEEPGGCEQNVLDGRPRTGAGADDLVEILTVPPHLSTSRTGLEDLLTKVATSAARVVPGADGAGLTLVDPDRGDTIVKSAPFVGQIDAIQYRLGEGPCISAAAAGRVMRSGSLGTDARWARFGSAAARLGVHSVLSLPLTTPHGVLGAMNVYAHAMDAFDEHAEHLGRLFAPHAASVVRHAQILAHAQRLATTLAAALTGRAVIDQAIGIVMARNGSTAEQALDRIRTLSRHERTTPAAVAARIVNDAVARARHTDN
jgi:GAF domain-containing protein